jgi:hypothetical protein
MQAPRAGTSEPTLRESARLRDEFYIEAEVTPDSRITHKGKFVSLTELSAMLPDEDNFAARARRDDPLVLKFLKVRVVTPPILALFAAVSARNPYHTPGLVELLGLSPELLAEAPEITIMEIAAALSIASSPGKPPAWHALPLTPLNCARTAMHAALKAGRPAEAIAIAALAGSWTLAEIAAIHPPPGYPGTQLHAEDFLKNLAAYWKGKRSLPNLQAGTQRLINAGYSV